MKKREIDICAGIPPELWERLTSFAKEHGLKKKYLVARALEEFLEANEK